MFLPKETHQEILPFNRRAATSSLSCILSSTGEQGSKVTWSLISLPPTEAFLRVPQLPAPDPAACHLKSAHNISLTLIPQLDEPWNIIKSMYGSKCIKYIMFSFLPAATWRYLYFWKLLPRNKSSYFYILSPDANNEVKGSCICIGIAETEKNRRYCEVKRFW